MPFAGDQPFWAERLRKLSIAPAALSSKGLKVQALTAAFAFAGQPSVVARARELGASIANENGLATAVSALEQWLTARRS